MTEELRTAEWESTNIVHQDVAKHVNNMSDENLTEKVKILLQELNDANRISEEARVKLRSVEKELELVKLQKANADAYICSLRQDVDRLKKQLIECRTCHINVVNNNNNDINEDGNDIRASCADNDNSELIEKCNINHESNKVIDQPSTTAMFNSSEDAVKATLPSAANDVSKDEVSIKNAIGTGSIADTLQSAAEECLVNNGLVYDEKSGWYYDWNNGYYYDPNTHLYYHNDTKAYYYYDQDKQEFVFYSYSNNDTTTNMEDELEEGEWRSDDEAATTDVDDGVSSCIRCIVMESNRLKRGSLYIITIDGAIIGRESDEERSIQIPELAISKRHAQIGYDKQELKFYLRDLDSTNGTYLNDIRIAADESSFYLAHNDVIKIGSTQLMFHIHSGYTTCDNCEPGQIQARSRDSQVTMIEDNSNVDDTEDQKGAKDQHRNELKKMKRKYGLVYDNAEDMDISNQGKYKDRSEDRRFQVGSDFPHAIQTSSSITKPIKSTNKGRKMLEKMGWCDGQGLGRDNTGMIEPVDVQKRQANVGLGTAYACSSLDTAGAPTNPSRSHKIIKITTQRYEEACTKSQSIDMFAD